ncbi:MAG: non-ribosomal peptide synthetase, partial [Pyrinomonadaceae bacterium]|nr:non-ribosomal peptide synthetase [Pyrinomonadaceae bacterium]
MSRLSKRSFEFSSKKRELLEALLQEEGVNLSSAQKISRRREADSLPLSFAQQRLWFLNQLEPDSPFYNVPAALRLSGPLNVAALEQSINEIIRRHESLRTTFAAVDGTPVQVIAPTLTLTLPIIDLEYLPESRREAETLRLVTEKARLPFDLAHGPLIRATLLRLDEEDHVLLSTIHHIAADGWSTGVFFRELGVLYETFSQNKSSPLAELPIQYADYAVWQREWLRDEVLEEQLSYWKEKLAGAPAVIELPTDRPHPFVQSYQGAKQRLTLSKNVTEGIKRLSQREGTTLFMTLLAAFQTLLMRYTSQDDIVVGTPIAGRSQAETENLIGFFVNTLALRTDLSGDPSFKEMLARVKEVTLGAYTHQDVPFEKLVEELQPERTLSRTPLFQVMFGLHNMPGQASELSGLKLSGLPLDIGKSQFDLSLFMFEGAEGLSCVFEYSTDLFDASTVRRMLGHFERLLGGIVADPDQRLSGLPLLSEAERYQLVVEWNATQAGYPQNQCAHHLFETQAAQTPEAVAVTFDLQQLT